MWFRFLAISVAFIALPAWPQHIADIVTQEPSPQGSGWQGFRDIGFVTDVLMTLSLAAILGAIIGFHPRNRDITWVSEGMHSPKIYVIYPVIGAIIGMMVVKYGLVVGFVLFGLGGVLRFRTVLRSASLTGRIILVTLIGLACGLNLLAGAVLSTLFAVVLCYILDSPVTYRIDIQELPRENMAEAMLAYRALIEKQGCHILYENKNCGKSRVTYVLSCKRQSTRFRLEKILESEVKDSLAGTVSWRVT
jgi:hypothetical protein